MDLRFLPAGRPPWEFRRSAAARRAWMAVAGLGAALLALGFWFDDPRALAAGLLTVCAGLSEQVPGHSAILRLGVGFIASVVLLVAAGAAVIALR